MTGEPTTCGSAPYKGSFLQLYPICIGYQVEVEPGVPGRVEEGLGRGQDEGRVGCRQELNLGFLVEKASDGVGVRNFITRFWLKNPNPQAIDVGLKTSRPPASPTLDSSRLADVLFD